MTLDDLAMDIALDDYTQAPATLRTRNEHPSVVLRDLATRRRPHGHVIAFANEKGGVGKSTLAFHCALALAHLDMRVLVIDCDRRQQTLNRLLEARDGTVRALKVDAAAAAARRARPAERRAAVAGDRARRRATATSC